MLDEPTEQTREKNSTEDVFGTIGNSGAGNETGEYIHVIG